MAEVAKIAAQAEKSFQAEVRKMRDYERSIAGIGTEKSTDKGGKSEKLRAKHTRRSSK